jgi:predicted AAA+ superfamily ATPase
MLKPRSLYQDVYEHVQDKHYTIITGARQVGKTSLLRLLFRQLKEENKPVFFFTLENHETLGRINQNPDHIFQEIPILPIPILEGKAEKRIFILIDEVQYANDPTHFLKYLYDRYEENVKIVATGSSAFYIDRKFKDSLAGRKRVFPLYPLSFAEFLSFNEYTDLSSEVNLLREREAYRSPHWQTIQNLFFKYLQYGGYPEVALATEEEEKKMLLNELKNAYIKRDIQESGIGKENKFYLLLQLLADQAGSLVNRNELANTVQVDFNTVDHYLYVLEKCHHIHLIKPYYRNLRKEITKMPKVFFNDLGLRNALLNRFDGIPKRPDKGALLENYYFLAFREKYQPEQIYFWRTADKQEVDFVIEKSFNQGIAYEIKWNPANFKASKYKKFVETYEQFPLTCLGVHDFLNI